MKIIRFGPRACEHAKAAFFKAGIDLPGGAGSLWIVRRDRIPRYPLAAAE